MILGIGMDVVEVKRIEGMISKYGDRFLKYVFTEREQAMAPCGKTAASGYYAGRWAAKEAISKVLGTGIGAHCGWRDITIEKSQGGRPCPMLSGSAEQTASAAGIEHLHVTISHEGHLACAAAVGEGAVD